MKNLLLITFLSALLAACGGGTGPTADGRSPDGDATTAEGREAAFTGTLGGDAQLEGGCAWLETEEEGRVEPRWPDGYRVEFDPVRLLGPDGDVVAEEGDTVAVDGEIAGDVMTICQVGPVLEVTEVVDVRGS